jgi:hypothetical protein
VSSSSNKLALVRPDRRERRRERKTDMPTGFCSLCGGPQVLCGGTNAARTACTGGAASLDDVRWLTAIRATYVGLLLTGSVATAWGGTLLRLARLVVGDTRPSTGLLQVAAQHAPLGRSVDNELTASLAMGYAGSEDLVQLDGLRSHVGRVWRAQGLAPWVSELYVVAYTAARTTPLAPQPIPLFAVRCARCWQKVAHKVPRERPPLIVAADRFDLAIRCPGCKEIPGHPLPVGLSLPHPVGRCVARQGHLPGEAEAHVTCDTHDDLPVDVIEGVCEVGREVMAEALTRAVSMTEGKSLRDSDLLDAVVRAQELARRRRTDAALTEVGRRMEGFVQALDAGAVDFGDVEHLEGAVRGALGLPDPAEEGAAGGFDLRKVATTVAVTVFEGLGLKGVLEKLGASSGPERPQPRARRKGER